MEPTSPSRIIPRGATPPATPEDLIARGETVQRVQTQYMTAVRVQKPRDLDAIVKALDAEAEHAGDEFYYSMKFEGKDGKTSLVEGGSIGLAVSIAREWGNCAADCDRVDESEDSWLFHAVFVDLEKGATIGRTFRQRKHGQVHGRFDPERKLDIAFQIGQSKAIRNVVFNGVPRWLIDRAVALAQDAEVKKITAEGLQAAGDKCVAAFAAIRVDEAALVRKIGRPRVAWASKDIALLRGDFAAIRSGDASAAELFPAEAPTPPAGPVKLADVMEAAEKPPTSAALGFPCQKCKASFADESLLSAHDKDAHAKKSGKGELFG